MARDDVLQARPNVPQVYPHTTWNKKRQEYWRYWDHFDGGWLDDTVSVDSNQLEYPLKLNPFSMPCVMHAGFLFGEVQDGDDPLVKTVCEPWGRDSTEQQREDAAMLTDVVGRVWYENSGRAIQQESGLISQILGGCVFGVAYDASLANQGRLPIRIDHVLPEYFFPVPAHNQYWHLLEAIVAYQISSLQAQVYDVEPDDYEQPHVLYQEHWKRDSYEITVDGKLARWADHSLRGRPVGISPPYVYIPHVRVGDFYGESLLKDKLPLAKEINNRFADTGDIVSMNAQQIPWMRNAQGGITIKYLGNGMPIYDLGQGIPGRETQPEMEYPSGNGQVSKGTIDWAMELLTQARIESYTPPVLYGVDEGSQRSALTLALRAIPLLVHIRQERTLYTSGLNQVARIILAIAADKGIEGVTREQVQNVRIWQEWSPIMPRDRDQLVNEMILRLNANLVSPETAMQKLGDIRDIESEMNLIKVWMEQKAKLEALGQPNPFGGAGSRGEQAGLSRPSEPKAGLTKGE